MAAPLLSAIIRFILQMKKLIGKWLAQSGRANPSTEHGFLFAFLFIYLFCKDGNSIVWRSLTFSYSVYDYLIWGPTLDFIPYHFPSWEDYY